MATPYLPGFPLPRPLVARRFGSGAGVSSSGASGGAAACLALAFAFALAEVPPAIVFAFGKGMDLARDSNVKEDWALSPGIKVSLKTLYIVLKMGGTKK